LAPDFVNRQYQTLGFGRLVRIDRFLNGIWPEVGAECREGTQSGGFLNLNIQDVMIIPTAAAVMTPKVAEPKHLSSAGFTSSEA